MFWLCQRDQRWNLQPEWHTRGTIRVNLVDDVFNLKKMLNYFVFIIYWMTFLWKFPNNQISFNTNGLLKRSSQKLKQNRQKFHKRTLNGKLHKAEQVHWSDAKHKIQQVQRVIVDFPNNTKVFLMKTCCRLKTRYLTKQSFGEQFTMKIFWLPTKIGSWVLWYVTSIGFDNCIFYFCCKQPVCIRNNLITEKRGRFFKAARSRRIVQIQQTYNFCARWKLSH